jgi:hypothetical protein
MRRLEGTAPVLMILVVTAGLWATNAGSATFIGSSPDSSDRSSRIQERLAQLAAANGSQKPARHASGFGWAAFELMTYVVLGIFVVALCGYLVSATVTSRRAPRQQLREAALVTNAIQASTVPAVLVTSTEEQLRAIQQGTPRNAIVACWWQLEIASESTGLPRHASETSAEFTKRVLGHYAVRAATIESLADLYREARFSVHVMTEEARERAVSALEQILVDLRTTASRDTPAGHP